MSNATDQTEESSEKILNETVSVLADGWRKKQGVAYNSCRTRSQRLKNGFISVATNALRCMSKEAKESSSKADLPYRLKDNGISKSSSVKKTY